MRPTIKHPCIQSESKRQRIINLRQKRQYTNTNIDSELVDMSTNNGRQLDDMSTNNGRQLDDTSINYTENLTSEMVDELVDVSTINSRQKKRVYKKVLKSAFDKIDDLPDMQLLVARFVIESAIQNGNLISDKIKSNDFLLLLINNGYKGTTLKKTIDRLTIEKQIFESYNCQRGPGGYRRFKIDEETRQAYTAIYGKKRLVKKEMVDEMVDTSTNDGKQLVDEISRPIGRQLVDQNLHLIDRYLSISFIIEPLKEFGFYFTEDDYEKVFSKLKDEQNVKQCLLHVAFGIKNNTLKLKKGSTHKDLFMGTVMSLGVFHSPKGYKSDKQIFIEQQIEQQKKEDALSKQLIDMEVQAWLKTLSEQQQNDLLSSRLRKYPKHDPLVVIHFTTYYLKHIKNKKDE